MSMTQWEQIAFYVTFAGYFIAMVTYILYLPFSKQPLALFGRYAAITGLMANSAAILLRMAIVHRPPLANGYEFILTFAWGIVMVYLLIENRFKLSLGGAFVMPSAFFLLAFVVFFMSGNERVMTSIQPALKSNWLTFHVITAMMGYGSLAVSFGIGILYLLKQRLEVRKPQGQLNARLPELQRLDYLGYKMIKLGFPLLTLCIITGAIWANYAWGTYWSWDPKETWSLVTWIIYAIYLHARLMYGWKGKRSAWLSVLGFLAVLFTFIGVNYLLTGLHSYA